jgi:hypothetical protein
MPFSPSPDKTVYDAAVTRYCEAVQTCAEVAAVFRFGRINKPGVSDLDLLVVVEDMPEHPSALSARSVFADNPAFLSLLLHDVAVLSVEDFRDLDMLYYVPTIDRVAGADICRKALEAPWHDFALAANAIDFAVPRMHRLLEFSRDRVNVQFLMVLSYAAIHTCDIVGRLCGCPPRLAHFAEQARRRRALGRPETVGSACEFARESFLILSICLGYVGHMLGARRDPPEEAALVEDARRALTIFHPRRPPNGHPDRYLHHTRISVHPSLFWYFQAYARTETVVGRAARRRLDPNLPSQTQGMPEAFLTFIERRCQSMDRRYSFLSTPGMEFSDMQVRPGFLVP